MSDDDPPHSKLREYCSLQPLDSSENIPFVQNAAMCCAARGISVDLGLGPSIYDPTSSMTYSMDDVVCSLAAVKVLSSGDDTSPREVQMSVVMQGMFNRPDDLVQEVKQTLADAGLAADKFCDGKALTEKCQNSTDQHSCEQQYLEDGTTCTWSYTNECTAGRIKWCPETSADSATSGGAA